MPTTEKITWYPVSDRLPDDEMTVLLWHPEMDEPVWLGYHLDGGWFAADSFPLPDGTVLYWAEMLAGPEKTSTCNCRADIEEMLLARFIEQSPEATEHKASLTGYGFLFSGTGLEMKGCMPFETTAKFPLKKGGVKAKTQKQSMMFNYCPFCGEKYPDQKKTG
ncbi:hypothetical protein QZJ86_12210 [Methylomonas montana]|uniref:hypothetical protein n=1 Tax=Methylomonas montana TaxID=3058963 RepID=UPI00265AD7C5|nr:hypothetical protein [Methylomonas montana]WKJ88786.1 hypothetical protein QZJ86_12210 [Methylomonas montana]